jgi:hypothetical protein
VPEPQLPHSPRHPDYLVTGDGSSFYLEARAVGEARSRAVSDKRWYTAIEPLRKIVSPYFTLDMQIAREGESAPPVARLRRRIERWLADLDPEDVHACLDSGIRDVPRLTVAAGDWKLTFRPIPRPPHRIGQSSPSGAISIFHGRTAWGGEWGRVGGALKKKARRYGDLERPFVMGLLSSAVFVDLEEIVSVIYGDPSSRSATGRTAPAPRQVG